MRIFNKTRGQSKRDKKKIFIGIFLDKEWGDKFTKYQKALLGLKDIRIVKEKNLHLTVFYIGFMKNVKIPQLSKSLVKVSQKNNPFILEFNGFILAPPNKTHSMVWGMFKKNHNFTLLAEDIKKEVQQLLIMEEDEKELLPHVTLARFNRSFSLSGLNVKMKDKDFRINKIALVESISTSSNPEYKIIKEFKLKDEKKEN